MLASVINKYEGKENSETKKMTEEQLGIAMGQQLYDGLKGK